MAIELLRAFEDLTFQEMWRPLRKVQEASTPHRKGTIRTVSGTGSGAVVTVNFDGRPATNYFAYQLVLLPT